MSDDLLRQHALADRLRTLAGRLREQALPAALVREIERTLPRWEATAADARGARPTTEPSRGSATAGDAAEPVRVWCDGSCAPNPGPGGWAAIVETDGEREELSGASPDSTNNIMEMTAAIEALRHTPEGTRVHVMTDSRYVMDGVTKWLPGWKRRNWRKADGNPVLNQSLWQALEALIGPRQVTWEWVRGHSGHPENERVDRLANEARTAQ